MLIGGAVYERIERQRDVKRLPQIGRSVDIGPTVIFDGGAPASGYSWIAVQREIAKFTHLGPAQ